MMNDLSLRRHLGCRVSMVFVLLSALSLSVWGKDVPSPTTASSGDGTYLVQPGDILEVFVWKEPDLSRKVLVRPDGFISFPLVQDLKAAGLPPTELKKLIEEKLKDFVTAPNVTVVVDTIKSYTIFVVGKVQRPGEFIREQPVSVLQSLSLAGGFEEYAARGSITVFRNRPGGNLVFKFDYDDVIAGKKAAQNIMLNSGDVVVVP